MATEWQPIACHGPPMASLPTLLGPLLSGLAGGLVSHALARLAARSRAPVRHGWRRVRPGAMHWTGVVLSGALVALMGWIGLFVGSSRPDAAFQMTVLWWLVAAFSAGGLACLWQMRAICRRDIAWRGTRLAFTGPGGQRGERPIAEIAGIALSPLRGLVVTFADGAILQVDPYAAGAAELMERIGAARDAG